MQNKNSNEQIVYSEDEIDLREIFATIVKYKTMLFSSTAFITICAVIFAFSKTPVYQVSATIEIGNIATEQEDKGVFKSALLEEGSMALNRFRSIYINSSDSKGYPKIAAIELVRGANNLIKITSESTDNTSANEKINECVTNIINDHEKKFNLYLSSMKNKIALLKEHKDELIKQNLENQIVLQQENIDAIAKNNAAVAAVYSMELSRKSQSVIEIKNRIFELSDRLNGFESAILPENIKNTHLIGEVAKNRFPVQPKKKLIITLGFLAGLFLSLFLVFFVEYVKKNKHESL
jgi:uncharacterized protein involved in exopolysaccharide biosynthesis